MNIIFVSSNRGSAKVKMAGNTADLLASLSAAGAMLVERIMQEKSIGRKDAEEIVMASVLKGMEVLFSKDK